MKSDGLLNSAQRFRLVRWLYLACFVQLGHPFDSACASPADVSLREEILEGFQVEEESFAGTELRLLQLGLILQRVNPQAANTDATNHSLWTPFQQRYVHVPEQDLAWAESQAAEQNPLLEVDELSSTLGAMRSPRSFPEIPKHRAAWIDFTDQDPVKGMVMGDIRIGAAADESDVTHYNIFWASNGTVMDFIAALPIGTYMHQLHASADTAKGVRIPKAANQMIVLTSNAAGMMDKGVSVPVFDHWRPPFKRLLKGLLRGI